MQSSNRVVLNAGILYGRMILTMGISLFSTRLVLNALGSKDYGIFNLIAGIIAMLSFLNVAMATSTQRFLSVAQGKKDVEMQKKIFANSLILHLTLAFAISCSLEIAGLFIFDHFLRIPEGRLLAAKAVYHFMSATVFLTIMDAPFTGTLNAHENISWLAVVATIQVALSFGLALTIFSITGHDRLIIYGFANPCITVFCFLLYVVVCVAKYEEASLKNWKLADSTLIKQLASFAGWNLFGSLCVLGKTQGMAIMLNIFFGAAINAAYGIGNQISAQLNFLSATLLQVINPQIMKSQGAGDTKRMLRLSMIASKFSFALMSMVAIPCIFEMPAILKFWLKIVPDYTIIFCDLILTSVLINQLTIGLQSAIQSTGKIKKYQMVVGTIILLNLPLAYFALKEGFSPYIAIGIFSIVEVVACIFRLYFTAITTGLKAMEYAKRVLFRLLIPVLIDVAICYICKKYFFFKFRFLLTASCSSIFYVLSIYFISLCEDEKRITDEMFRGLSNKISKLFASKGNVTVTE